MGGVLGDNIGLGVDAPRLVMSGDDLGVSLGGKGGRADSTDRGACVSFILVSADVSCASGGTSTKISGLRDASSGVSCSRTESGDGSGSTGGSGFGGTSFFMLGLILRSSDKSTSRSGGVGIAIDVDGSTERVGWPDILLLLT